MMVSLSLQQLSKSFAGKCIFSNLNLELSEFGIVAVVAENGVGKSTLLAMIAGMLDFDTGNILINDQQYAPHNNEYKKLVAYVPDKSPIYDFLQGQEFLNLMCDIRGIAHEQYQIFIEKFKLEHYLSTPFADMSFGTTKKFLLVAALMTTAPLLILDEPSNGLDQNALAELTSILLQQSQSKLILLSCHDPVFRDSLAAKIIELDRLKSNEQAA
ncbi:ABC transporter ATP-binding protein [Acinetobacter sp. YH1901134]|uniref:ABC transporter ATP-binding protein n=1 Tax=Acinetobacter sp. YH1901134 TaxID=2601199 RepID=UPI0015D21333|nr:ABC transporter ATP-binding protein [Acinetobacter sp. YH1901134]